VVIFVVPAHCLAVAAAPVRRDWVSTAVDVRDVVMTKSHQMVDDEPQSFVIGGPNDIDTVRCNPTAHQNDRDGCCKIIERRLSELGAKQDQRLTPELQQRLDCAALIVASSHRTEHDLVAPAVGDFLNAFNQFGVEGITHIHRHAKVPRPMQLQQARRSIGAITQLLGHMEYPCSRRFAGTSRASEHDRNQGFGDARGCGDISHGRSSTSDWSGHLVGSFQL
jgi:hypothetical protein